jgi:uncharacterized protein DUF3800
VKYVVYCDESRHEGPQSHRYMAIGGLWLRSDRKLDLTKRFSSLCRSLGLNSEVKWSKASHKKLAEYKTLVDFFVHEDALRFRVIVVDQARVDAGRFHRGDRELGFYKFYYQMLVKWIEQGQEYLILLDFKQNQGANRYKDLRRVLERRFRAKATISDLTVINSSQSPLAQLCDLLTGSVAASCCSDRRTGSAKSELALYIARSVGFQSLAIACGDPGPSKFNIFRIRLSD